MLFKLVALLGLAVSASASICPSNTYYSYNDGMCYYSFNSTLLWSSAVNYCNSMSGDLVVPRNAFDNSLFEGIIQEFNSLGSWLGVFSDNNGQWFDNSGNPISYTRWAPGQPSMSGSCATMTPDGYWYSDYCDRGDRFICGINPNGPVTQKPVYTTPTTTATTTTRPTTKAPVVQTTTTVPSNPIISCKGYNNTHYNPCSAGWKFYVNTCSCYYYPQTTARSWYEAEQYCVGQRSHLASIHSQDEAVFVKGLANVYDKYIHIGLQNIGGTWLWTDGSKVDFLNWSYNDYNSDVNTNSCGMMYSDGYYFATYLGNIPCTDKQYNMVCKKHYV